MRPGRRQITYAAPQGSRCTVHAEHRPRDHVPQVHHILPKEYGGQTVDANLVVVCATGHQSIHEALRLLLRTKGSPGAGALRSYSHGERALAWEGYRRIVARPSGPSPSGPRRRP